MRIVAFVPGGIGDQLLFFPTLDDLKQIYPNAQLDVVIEPRAKAAYQVSRSVHNTILFDYEDRNSLADFGNLLGAVREQEYDVAISLGRGWGIGLALWLTGIPIRIGYAGTPGQVFLTNTVPLKPDQYAACMYHDLLKGLDIHTPCPELSINVSTKDLDWADAERKRLGLQSSGYVLIHGGFSQRSKDMGINKIYPVESWKGIIQDFERRQPDLPLVVVQEPEDEKFVQELVQSSPKLKVTVPEDIGKLAAMIAGANLMLCTDSAPMHLAVAVKTYTLALFGSTDPKRLLPESNRFVGIKSLTGQLADISPQMVLEKVWGG